VNYLKWFDYLGENVQKRTILYTLVQFVIVKHVVFEFPDYVVGGLNEFLVVLNNFFFTTSEVAEVDETKVIALWDKFTELVAIHVFLSFS